MDDDQQFCLRWNNHQSTLVTVLDTLYGNQCLVDCTLAAEGKCVNAHKVVLSACSPYFETILARHFDKHPILILKDVKFKELQAMMDYMYKGEVNISQDQLGALLKAAESLQIKGLSDNRKGETERKPTPHTLPVKSSPNPAATLPKVQGLTIEQHTRDDSRDGSQSPGPRKKKRMRQKSEELDNHDASNSSESHSLQSISSQNIPSLPTSSKLTTTDVPEPLETKSEILTRHKQSTDDIPQVPIIKEKLETHTELMLEPKSEYVEEMNEDSIEDLTLDDDDISNMESMDDGAGPSHSNVGEGSGQVSFDGAGFGGWHMGNQSQDEVFLAAQEAVGAHRDSQEVPWLDPLPDFEDLSDFIMEEREDNMESDGPSEHSDHETDTEQSAVEDSGDEVGSSVNAGSFSWHAEECTFTGKDQTTKWLTRAPRKKVRTRKYNIVTKLPGVKRVAKSAKSALECWRLFFPKETIDYITECTNIMLGKMREKYSRERDCTNTNREEIEAFFGLLYMAGLKKAQHVNVRELWKDDSTSPECFRAVMSYKRFYILLRALRFDNVNDHQLRKQEDNLAPIRRIFSGFVEKCQENYQVGEYTTIDEMLPPFRGRCKFRQYIANKPSKHGIKVYALVDSHMFYTANLEIYAGKQPEGQYRVDNSASSVVKRLSSHIINTGRNITMDNYFTSLPLARDLLQQNTTIVGTMRKNKREIPPIFINTKERPANSSIFAFSEECMLVSYVPKKNKNVLLLSTLHEEDKIYPESGDRSKPEVVTFFNLTKGGVNVVNELASLYSMSRISCRWPLTIFFLIMNIAGINSQIIHTDNNERKTPRRIYLKTLALELMKPHVVKRLSICNLQPDLKISLKKVAGLEIAEVAVAAEPVGPTIRGKCRYCPGKKNRYTKKQCAKCGNSVCNTHCKFVCINCTGAQEPAFCSS